MKNRHLQVRFWSKYPWLPVPCTRLSRLQQSFDPTAPWPCSCRNRTPTRKCGLTASGCLPQFMNAVETHQAPDRWNIPWRWIVRLEARSGAWDLDGWLGGCANADNAWPLPPDRVCGCDVCVSATRACKWLRDIRKHERMMCTEWWCNSSPARSTFFCPPWYYRCFERLLADLRWDRVPSQETRGPGGI